MREREREREIERERSPPLCSEMQEGTLVNVPVSSSVGPGLIYTGAVVIL